MFLLITGIVVLFYKYHCPFNIKTDRLIKKIKLDQLFTYNIIRWLNLVSINKSFEQVKFNYCKQQILSFLIAISLILSWAIHGVYIGSVYIFAVSALIISFPMFKLREKANKIEREIEMNLPVLLMQMMLLLNTGMSILNAMSLVTEDQRHILEVLFYQVSQEVVMGESMERALLKLSDQCQNINMTRFSRIMVSDYINGTKETRTLFYELIQDLRKNKRALALKKGEEASTKLLLPMALALMSIVVAVTVPALYEIFILL